MARRKTKRRFSAFKVETENMRRAREESDEAERLANSGSCGLAMSHLVRSEYYRGRATGCEGGEGKMRQAPYDAVRRCFVKR